MLIYQIKIFAYCRNIWKKVKCASRFLTFVVADFAPAFANIQRIEPLLLLDQVFVGFCLQFLFVATAVFCFGRNQQKQQANNFSEKSHSNQKTNK